ncbi:hypothetical protein O181_059035 [Austropuccinia psidii MF-1]|uniref:Uncharacterized protein n=1 Tax=Austropuccinia psidii MF-1 TaxID=1389203 RepID=A0A9Q3EHP3_9BASI|nr:hypothetical protein [Austropuccinia psidii MF-1]
MHSHPHPDPIYQVKYLMIRWSLHSCIPYTSRSSTIFEHLQLEPLIENYICCPKFLILSGLTESVTTDQPHCQRHNAPNEHDPPCTQSLGQFIHLVEPQTQNTTNIKENSSQQNISFIYHSKIGFPVLSSRLALWNFCININNPKNLKVPPNLKSGMDCSGEASLAPEISMTPHSCPFPVHWPSKSIFTGLMHMESQAAWPELDLSC